MWSRFCGVLLAIGGIAALYAALTSGDIAGYWPALAAGALLLWLASKCFRANTGMLDLLGNGPPNKRK